MTVVTGELSELNISPVGIGAWAWGDRLFWGYGRGQYTDSDLEAAFEAALIGGVNWFDTAEIYGSGRSETLLGQFIHSTDQTVMIATKFFPYPYRIRRSALVKALRKSLSRLRLDQVDLYQIHRPSPPVPIRTWVHALADVAASGLAKTVGVSNYNRVQTQLAHRILAERGIKLASNQVEYSLIQRRNEHNGLLETCHKLGITVIAYSPLGMGMLTGKYTPESPPSGVRSLRYRRSFLDRIQPLVSLMREIGEVHGSRTPAQVALNWVISKGAVPIPGAKNARQAEENASSTEWQLSVDEVTELEQAAAMVL